MKLFRKYWNDLWNDDRGFIISVEMLFIVVIMVIGLTAGFTALRQGVATELAAVGNAVAALDEGYTINGLSSPGGKSDSTSVVHTPVTNVSVTVTPPASQPPIITPPPPPPSGGPPGVPGISTP